MSSSSYKNFIIALLLLAFTSQILAVAAMTCEPDKATQPAAMVINMDIHAHHHMSDMATEDMSVMHHMDQSSTTHNKTYQQSDCCKIMGHCLLNGCSFAAVNNEIIFLIIQSDFTAIDFYLSVAPNPHISSPYRPPIFS